LSKVPMYRTCSSGGLYWLQGTRNTWKKTIGALKCVPDHIQGRHTEYLYGEANSWTEQVNGDDEVIDNGTMEVFLNKSRGEITN
jgi:hypothetical protein